MPRERNARVSSGPVSRAAGTALALLLLTACSSAWVSDADGPTPGTTAGPTASTGATASPSTTASPRTSTSATGPGSSSIAKVSCQADSCTVVLAGRDTRVRVFDTTIAFLAIDEGRATLQVEQEEVACTEGTDVPAGRLTLTCTRVTDDQVEFTARPR